MNPPGVPRRAVFTAVRRGLDGYGWLSPPGGCVSPSALALTRVSGMTSLKLARRLCVPASSAPSEMLSPSRSVCAPPSRAPKRPVRTIGPAAPEACAPVPNRPPRTWEGISLFRWEPRPDARPLGPRRSRRLSAPLQPVRFRFRACVRRRLSALPSGPFPSRFPGLHRVREAGFPNSPTSRSELHPVRADCG
jgi:hypothetical protein